MSKFTLSRLEAAHFLKQIGVPVALALGLLASSAFLIYHDGKEAGIRGLQAVPVPLVRPCPPHLQKECVGQQECLQVLKGECVEGREASGLLKQEGETTSLVLMEKFPAPVRAYRGENL